MLVHGDPAERRTRFDWIIQGYSRGPNAVFDEDLAGFQEAAVIPTRGAFLVEWLLVVPRKPCLGMAELSAAARCRVLAVADTVLHKVSDKAGAGVMLEHGPARRGSIVGCGVDQAHLHVVGGAPDLLDRLMEAVAEEAWSAADHDDPWRGMPTGSDYLMIRNQERAVRAIVKTPTSQRLRRALADLLGQRYAWDYRSHPHQGNARRTKEMFRGAFADAPT